MTASLDPERAAALAKSRKRGLFDIVGGIFLVVGAVVLIGGIAWGGYTIWYQSTSESTTATVVDRVAHHGRNDDGSASVTYSVTVEYTVAGRVYRHTPSGSSNPAPQVGDRVTVYYRADDPQDAMLGGASAWIGVLIAVPLGLILAGLGGLLVYLWRRTRRRDARAITTGRRIRAVVEGVSTHTSTDADGDRSTSWVLVARYDDPVTRTVQRFSREFGSAPRSLPAEGEPITVYVDEKDPSVYSVVLP